MIDLKLSKKNKKEMEKEAIPTSMEEEYPYGTRLRFENETIQKIPALQDIKAGAMMEIKAIGKVMEVRITDQGKGKNYEIVEVQIQKIEIGNANEAEEAFEE